jgi:NTE family protein
MIAFVLSGGSNRGPLQVGALRAIHEAGIRPAFLVGTSVGAINAAHVSARGFSEDSLDALADSWRKVSAKTVYPGNLFTMVWRMIRKRDSLYSSDGMRQFIDDRLEPGLFAFGQLRLPLYVPAADLRYNRLFMFGENPNTPIVDAVLASASVPVIHPPVRFRDLQLVDGGVLANVAASYAMDKGANEIYVVNVSSTEQEEEFAEGVVDVAFRTLNTMLVQSLRRDLTRARESDAVDLHHVHIADFRKTWFKDFSHTEEMFGAGFKAMEQYLKSPKPQTLDPEDIIPSAVFLSDASDGGRAPLR